MLCICRDWQILLIVWKLKTKYFCACFRPLQRMGWGMVLAAISFLLAAFLQIAVDVRKVVNFSVHIVLALVFSLPYFSKNRAIDMSCRSSVRLSVTDVLWLNGARLGLGCYLSVIGNRIGPYCLGTGPLFRRSAIPKVHIVQIRATVLTLGSRLGLGLGSA